MSQPPAGNLPNGLPPNMRPQEKPRNIQHPFNGVDSSHSSRSSSPSARFRQIPPSQLPFSKDNIPSNQLPPNVSPNVGTVTQSMRQLQMTGGSSMQNTPNVSPRVQNFNTSTPVSTPSTIKPGLHQNTGFSPIVSNVMNTSFSHSSTSHFTNVPLNNGPVTQESKPVSSASVSQTKVTQSNAVNNFQASSTHPRSFQQMNTSQSVPNLMKVQQLYYNNVPQTNSQPRLVSQSNMPMSQPNTNTPQFVQQPNVTVPPVVQGYNSNYPAQIPQETGLPQAIQQRYPVPSLQQNAPQVNKTSVHANRYPTQQVNPNVPQQPYQNNQQGNQNQQQKATNMNQQYLNQMGTVAQTGFNKLWGTDNIDLLACPNILPPTKVEPARVSLGQNYLDAANCSADVFRCTVTKIPESNSLLQKSRLPLGILIHPFKDLNHLPVIQCSNIVRCRVCRTYINPFVFFVDSKRWKCNLCYRVNELPEEFQYDPVSKTYGDPSRRPEIKSSTIEYIAPQDYMLRPPQPAVYLFLLDVSRLAVESGYLHTVCNVLAAELTNLPGDARTQIGFLAYDSALHFFFLGEGLSQPHEMTVLDIDDVFLPMPDNLVVNLKDRMELITDLLTQLPTRYNNNFDTNSALGSALQAAHKLIFGTGGRVTVFQATLSTIGHGSLTAREDPSQRAAAEVQHLNPANDFYKRLSLECSTQQIAVDLFIINSQYVDIATISGISRFSGGCIYQFPLFKASRALQSEALERSFRRYLTRKVGFEAVMRVRCTRGLSIHTFHGNFFVRSPDLLSLPNINPDAGFGMQIAIDESLTDVHTVCFQAALLYTSSKGERRIRVHTLCLPVASTLQDVINSADQQCIVGLLAKMAVDRSLQSSLSDAREALVNVAIDILSIYKLSLNLGSGMSGLLAPQCLTLLPLYISALLKYVAFRVGTSTRLDDRVKHMLDMKTRPLNQLVQCIYPDLYPVHNLEEQKTILNEEEVQVPQPPHLQLTARNIDAHGAYLLDMGEHMIILVCPSVTPVFLNQALGVPDYNSITEEMFELPILENPCSQRLNCFVNYLNDDKPFVATMQIIRENSAARNLFYERLIEDRIENALSYHEFLQHLKTQVK